MIVVDASAAVEVFLNTAAGAAARMHLRARQPAIVPASFDAEVYAALRRTYLHEGLDRAWLTGAVGQLIRFVAERTEIVSLLPGAIPFADAIGAHDVFYALLALKHDCPLLTCDRRLARAASRSGIEVVAIAG